MFIIKFLLKNKAFLMCLLCLFACMTSACSNKPINYYLMEMPQALSATSLENRNLSSHENKNTQKAIPTGVNLSGPILALSQVLIPQYLDRQQIVTREHNVDFSIDENNRWGEELSAGISRVLCTSLSKHLSEIGATSSPLRVGLNPDYTISLEIRSFEGTLEGDVRLRALWTLESSTKRRSSRERTERIEENIRWQAFFDKALPTGTSYTSYVNAYGALVDLLALEISHVFMELYEKK